MSYQLKISRQVYQQVANLPGHIRQRVRQFINTLSNNPRPTEAKPLRNQPNLWRYRVDHWRVVWRIYDDELLVIIIKVGRKHGPEFYADLLDEE